MSELINSPVHDFIEKISSAIAMNDCDGQITQFAVLKLAVTNNKLEEVYAPYIESHNNYNINNVFFNSGFDLFFPNIETFTGANVKMVSMDVKAEMITCDAYLDKFTYTSYYMYPRSSMSKTPLILGNHTGIIDSGYRGNLIGAFKNLSNVDYIVSENTRLLQICHPQLLPIFVILVAEDELTSSERGEGGFGSTGK